MITWLKDGVPLDSVEDRISLDDENTLTIKGLTSILKIFLKVTKCAEETVKMITITGYFIE
jgi:hypothetical protein